MRPETAKELIGTASLLDVREPYEWDSGHIEDSIHIPLGEITARVDELDTQRPIVVVCQVGQRSALVADWLSDRGFEAHNLEGGLAAWEAAGLPLVGETSPPGPDQGWGKDDFGETSDPGAT